MDTTLKIPKNVKVTKDIEEYNLSRNSDANYTCDYCSFKAMDHKNLIRHMDIEHKESYKTYSCYQCDYEFRYKNDLIKHMETRHRRKEFWCYQCKYKATEKFKLFRHIKYSHEKKYRYDKSKYPVIEKDNLPYHNNSKYNSSLYSCNKCDHKAYTHESLNIHKQSSHNDIKYQKSNTNMLKRRDNSSQNDSKYKYNSIICDQCDYKTSKQSQLIYHKKTEHEGNNFKRYKTLWKSNHTSTNNSINNDRTYRCDQCDYYWPALRLSTED